METSRVTPTSLQGIHVVEGSPSRKSDLHLTAQAAQDVGRNQLKQQTHIIIPTSTSVPTEELLSIGLDRLFTKDGVDSKPADIPEYLRENWEARQAARTLLESCQPEVVGQKAAQKAVEMFQALSTLISIFQEIISETEKEEKGGRINGLQNRLSQFGKPLQEMVNLNGLAHDAFIAAVTKLKTEPQKQEAGLIAFFGILGMFEVMEEMKGTQPDETSVDPVLSVLDRSIQHMQNAQIGFVNIIREFDPATHAKDFSTFSRTWVKVEKGVVGLPPSREQKDNRETPPTRIAKPSGDHPSDLIGEASSSLAPQVSGKGVNRLSVVSRESESGGAVFSSVAPKAADRSVKRLPTTLESEMVDVEEGLPCFSTSQRWGVGLDRLFTEHEGGEENDLAECPSDVRAYALETRRERKEERARLASSPLEEVYNAAGERARVMVYRLSAIIYAFNAAISSVRRGEDHLKHMTSLAEKNILPFSHFGRLTGTAHDAFLEAVKKWNIEGPSKDKGCAAFSALLKMHMTMNSLREKEQPTEGLILDALRQSVLCLEEAKTGFESIKQTFNPETLKTPDAQAAQRVSLQRREQQHEDDGDSLPPRATPSSRAYTPDERPSRGRIVPLERSSSRAPGASKGNVSYLPTEVPQGPERSKGVEKTPSSVKPTVLSSVSSTPPPAKVSSWNSIWKHYYSYKGWENGWFVVKVIMWIFSVVTLGLLPLILWVGSKVYDYWKGRGVQQLPT